MPTDILPTGFTSIDLQQGGTTAFSGSIAGVEGGPTPEPLYTPDRTICQAQYIPDVTVTSSADVYRPIYSDFKAWTLDWIDLRVQIPSDSGDALTIGFFKQSVGDDAGEIVSGDRIGAELTFDPSSAGDQKLHTIRCHLGNIKERVRRFEPGETFTIGFGFNDTGITLSEIFVSFLGRNANIG